MFMRIWGQPHCPGIFLCNVIVIAKDYAKDNRHSVIVLSKSEKNMLSAKMRWSDKSFLNDCL